MNARKCANTENAEKKNNAEQRQKIENELVAQTEFKPQMHNIFLVNKPKMFYNFACNLMLNAYYAYYYTNKQQMEKIAFNLMQLIEDTQKPGERFLNPEINSFHALKEQFHTYEEGTFYEIKTKKTNDYIWFEFDYGKPRPIDEELTNIKTGDKKKNPRDEDEVEITRQFFVLYKFDTKILYISNLKKKNIFADVISSYTGVKFEVKTFFKNADEFISSLKSIDKITFTEAKNIFNKDSQKRKALIDLTGTDAPDNFTIEAKYHKNFNISSFVSDLISSKTKRAELKDLVIEGTDESDFHFVFNVDSFVRKIDIECQRKDNGKYDENYIFEKIIEKTRCDDYERC